MKKESSEQQRVLRKLVRLHKPTLPAMSAPIARKTIPVVPVGRRTTRSEAAKIRAERELHGKVSPTIKIDSKQSEDSSESTDSQSEQQKQNTNVPLIKTNDHQSETNSQPETVEENSAKKPRKKRISRALFRHDTIDYIKPKKQELLQRTFSLGFRKLVNISKEIYTKNDDLTNDEETNTTENKETAINEGHETKDNATKVVCPMKSPQNSTINNEEKQNSTLSSNTIIQSKSIEQILDMPSLDSPNSLSELCTTQVNCLNKMNKINSAENSNNIEAENEHHKVGSKKKEKQKHIEAKAQPKKTNLKDKLSTTTVSRNLCHVQTNSSQKLHYPFYGIIPNKQNTITSEEQLNNQLTVEDEIPKYKITIVNNSSRAKTNESLHTNPHLFLTPKEVPQFKIPPPSKSKQQVVENQIKFPQYPENQMHHMSQMPYPYFHPNYGYPYNLNPFLPPGYPQNYVSQEQLWNTHQMNNQQNLHVNEALLNQDKRPRFSPENTAAHQENMRQRQTNLPGKETLINQERRVRFSPENLPAKEILHHVSRPRVSPETRIGRQENRVRYPAENVSIHQENLRQRQEDKRKPETIVIRQDNLQEKSIHFPSKVSLTNQEKRPRFPSEPTIVCQDNLQQRNINVPSKESLTNQDKRPRFSPENIRQKNTAQDQDKRRFSLDNIAVHQENLRQLNTNLSLKETLKNQETRVRFSPEIRLICLENNTAPEKRARFSSENPTVDEAQTIQKSNHGIAINSQTTNNLNHEIPIIHKQNKRHTNKNLNEAKIDRPINCTIVQEQRTRQTVNNNKDENLNTVSHKNVNYSKILLVPSHIINYSKIQSEENLESRHKNLVSQIPLVQRFSQRYPNSNREQKELQMHHDKHVLNFQQNINIPIDNSLQCSENRLQGQKRCISPIKNKINHKRVHFDSNLNDKNNLLRPINYSKPDIDDGVSIINVNKMPNNLASQTATFRDKEKKIECSPEQKHVAETKESVIVSPNNRRSIPEISEQRVIVQTNDNLHSDHHNNLHNQNKNNILFMQDKNHTPAEYNNKIMQTNCSVIKKVCIENKNQHTIENILSNKCSVQNKTNNGVNNKNDKIKILNIETINKNDGRYNINISEDNLTTKTVIAGFKKVIQYPENTKNKIAREKISNNPTPSRISNRRKTIQHIDLTCDTDQEKNTNSLNLQQQLRSSDIISLNDTQALVVSCNRLSHTPTEYSNMKTGKDTQNMAPVKSIESKTVEVSERPMPKLIKVPEQYLNKRSKIETNDRRNQRSENSRIAEKSDNRSSPTASRVNINNYASKNVVPFIKPAHSNNVNKIAETTTVLPLNLSLKNDAQLQNKTSEQDKDSDQNKRQSIIVNNKSSTHKPLGLTSLSFVKSEEEYKGYLKLLKEKNATGPYLFYKFITSVRKRNNEPIFDLITFFSLLKQGKLVEYKNMYNQCNNN